MNHNRFREHLKKYNDSEDPVHLISEHIKKKNDWISVEDIGRRIEPWRILVKDILYFCNSYEKTILAELEEGLIELRDGIIGIKKSSFFKGCHDILEAYGDAVETVNSKLQQLRFHEKKKNSRNEIDAIMNSHVKSLEDTNRWLKSELEKNRIFAWRRTARIKEILLEYLQAFTKKVNACILLEGDIEATLKDIHDKLRRSIMLLEKAGIRGTENLRAELELMRVDVERLLRLEKSYGDVIDKRIDETISYLDAEKEKSLHLALKSGYRHMPYDIHSIVFVHMTRFFPANGVIRTRVSSDGGLRDTLHFTINGPVANIGFGGGDWEAMPVAILIPGSAFPLKRIRNLARFDTFIFGNLKLPRGSIIVIDEGVLVNAARERNMTVDSLYRSFEERGILIRAEPKGSGIQKAVINLLKKTGRDAKEVVERLDEGDTWRIAEKLGVSSERHISTKEHKYESLRDSLQSIQRFFRTEGNWSHGLFDARLTFFRGDWVSTERSFHGLASSINWIEEHCMDQVYRRICGIMIDMAIKTLKLADFVFKNIRENAQRGKLGHERHNRVASIISSVYGGIEKAKVGENLFRFSPKSAREIGDLLGSIRKNFEACREILNKHLDEH